MDRILNLLQATAVAICDAQSTAIARHYDQSASATAAILTLGQHPGLALSDIAPVVGITHSAMVRLIDGLDRQGLVTRTTGCDKRKVAVTLTEAGLNLYRGIRESQASVLTPLLSDVSEQDRIVIERALARLLKALTQSRESGDHICRFCDELSCPQDQCPVEAKALMVTQP